MEQEEQGKLPRNLLFVSNKWFPAAHVDHYVAAPLGKPLIGVGNIVDLHQYYWLNSQRPELHKGDSALCIVPSNYPMILELSYYRDFNYIELLKIFYSYRSGHMARFFRVYLLKDYKMEDELHRNLQHQGPSFRKIVLISARIVCAVSGGSVLRSREQTVKRPAIR